jgi:peptidoglycan/LPS O-acetylase OafA/YrhL
VDAPLKVQSRNPQLDVLRGIAVLLAVGGHRPYYQLWSRFGGRGVDLFFVLSGFLISGLLFKEYIATGTIRFSRFFIRRGFKIYPAYYFFLLVLLPFTFRKVTWADFFFMQAYWPHHWGHGWSLSIEEHFYLLLPACLLLSLAIAPRSDFRWIPRAFPIVLAACLAMRMTVPFNHQGLLTGTHYRLDALFAGVTLSWFYRFRRERFDSWRGVWLLAAGITLILPEVIWHLYSSYWLYTLGQTSLLIGFSCLLLWAVHSPWLAKFTLLGRLGFYSYSIYMWHWPIALFFQTLPNSFLWYWCYLFTAIVIGILMARIVEIPMLRLRDQYFPALRHRENEHPSVACQSPELVSA